MAYPKIILRKGKEESLLRRHPWIFSGAIERAEGPIEEGDIVDVHTRGGDFVARGHSQVGSIAVRVLTFADEAIDQQWWNARIASALALRRALGLVGVSAGCGERDGERLRGPLPAGGGTGRRALAQHGEKHVPPIGGADRTFSAPASTALTDTYRLVHGEGDLLPGLVVDIYGATAVVQCHSVGMYLVREDIVAALRAAYGDTLRAIFDKSSQTLPHNAGLDAVDGYLWRSDKDEAVAAAKGEAEIVENGYRFIVDCEHGQKTGFYIDQRENRRLVGGYAAGRRVLNAFSYTGGFSVYALGGGAVAVDSVDSSERAVELAARNVALNFGPHAPHRAIARDAFDFLNEMPDGAYDMIILDPPAFAKHHKVLGNATQGYRRLNARAMQKIAPGGILFTFSCSQAVSRELFRTTVFSAAALAGRRVRILHQLTQPADHPIDIYHPEGEYLKGLVLYVE